MKRIILTINANGTATARGFFIDHREATNSINKTYSSEQNALEDFHNMRERSAEFSYTINRKA